MTENTEETIVLFGLSGNPSTIAHLNSGLAIHQQTGFPVCYVPAFQNPDKSPEGMELFHHRFEMAKLNIEGHPGLSVTDVEREICQQRDLKTLHTTDLLQTLCDLYPKRKMIFAMGTDSFHKLHTWHGWNDVNSPLRNTPILVVPRLTKDNELHLQGPPSVTAIADDLIRAAKEHTARAAAARDIGCHVDHPRALLDKTAYHILSVEPTDISAEAVREEIKFGNRQPEFLRPEVFQYIKQHRLYLTSEA